MFFYCKHICCERLRTSLVSEYYLTLRPARLGSFSLPMFELCGSSSYAKIIRNIAHPSLVGQVTLLWKRYLQFRLTSCQVIGVNRLMLVNSAENSWDNRPTLL